ncbi:MAG: TrmH family RNA methyltransferase [Balneolaceae bacterium]
MAIKHSTKEILSRNRARNSPFRQSLLLWAHNIRSLHNTGSLFRSADAFGVDRLLLTGYTPVPPRREISKTALGAESTVSWESPNDIVQCASGLKNKGYILIGLEQTDESIELPEFEFPEGKICLMLGNEVTGLNEELFPWIDHFVEIPQYGEKHSLNVSVAAGVALYALLASRIPNASSLIEK